jgi:phosphoribosylanthranilate isomerase
MTQIKICGITCREDALMAAKFGADALGFIFYNASPRCVTPEAACSIIHHLPDGVARVGVFVNHDASKVSEIAAFCALDLIQFHGDETPDYCRLFPADYVIKALSPRTLDDLETLAAYPVKAILVDHREAGCYGGSGRTSNWELAGQIKRLHPLILAGGLHEGNIEEAIRIVAPDAVDINSGVEGSPGKKNPEKVMRIIEIIRKIDSLHPRMGGERFSFRELRIRHEKWVREQ